MPQPYQFSFGDHTLPIRIRKHRRAKRMVLRYAPKVHAISLTLPRYVTITQGLHFVEEKRNWITQQINSHPERILPQDGSELCLLGKYYQIRHIGGRGLVTLEDKTILVPGDAAFLLRRLREWMATYLHQHITQIVAEKTTLLEVHHRTIRIRNTHSCWGSCTADGALNFSSNLIFAPPEVVEYVICHEVAHLKEMNHSKYFWQWVEKLCPDYKTHRAWLKKHGNQLQSAG